MTIYIEELGKEGVVLCHPMVPLEGGSMVSSGLGHNGKPCTVLTDYRDLLGEHTIAYQDI